MSHPETFAPEDPYAPRRSNSGCTVFAIIFGAIAGVGVLILLCCGGGIYFAMDTMVANQVAEDLRDNPVINEHVGRIRDTDFVFSDSFAAGPDEYVIEVVGTKGNGRLIVETEDAGGKEHVISGFLETPDGERHDLFPEGAEDVEETEEAGSVVPAPTE